MRTLLLFFVSLCLFACTGMNSDRGRTPSSLNPNGSADFAQDPLNTKNAKLISDLQRKLSEVASLQQVGPDGSVYFYYLAKEEGGSFQLNIIKCEKYSVIKEGLGCEAEKDSKSLSLPYIAALESMKTFLEIYLGVDEASIPTADKYKALEAFIIEHGAEMADPVDIAKMKSDKSRREFVQKAIANFDRDIRSEKLDTIRYEGEGVRASILLDMFNSFLQLNEAKGDLKAWSEESRVEVSATGLRKKNFIMRWLTWENYGEFKKELILEIEGYDYLSPDGVSILKKMSLIGFDVVECKYFLKGIAQGGTLERLRPLYRSKCEKSPDDHLVINKAVPDVFELNGHLGDRMVKNLVEHLFPGKTLNVRSELSLKNYRKFSDMLFDSRGRRSKVEVKKFDKNNKTEGVRYNPRKKVYRLVDKKNI